MKQFHPFIFMILLIVLTENQDVKNNFQVLKEYSTSEIMDLIENCKTKNYKIIDPEEFVKPEDEKNLKNNLKNYTKITK